VRNAVINQTASFFEGRHNIIHAVGNASCFIHELSFYLSFLYQSTVLSSRVVDGHEMYFGGLVVGKASTVGIEISLTPSLIFKGGSKSVKFGVVFDITQI